LLLSQLLCLFFFPAFLVAAPASASAASFADAAPLAGRHGGNNGQQRSGSKAACNKDAGVPMRVCVWTICIDVKLLLVVFLFLVSTLLLQGAQV
jgi:hypothetical protein